MRSSGIIAVALVGIFAASSAEAVPLAGSKPEASGKIEIAHAWRYHRGCSWRDGRWVVDLGAGRLVVCRPHRPRGHDWTWHRDGGHEGWWHRRHHRWHHKW